MGQMVELTTKDRHVLDAYRADPSGAVKGGLVVIQEIFGVNGHIRNLCDEFAAEGYQAVAPCLFDRVERGLKIDYDGERADRQVLRAKLSDEMLLADVQAAADSVRDGGDVGIVGYCFGGYVVWIGAVNLDFACAIPYYGGGIVACKELEPKCPMQLHFGAADEVIAMADVEGVMAAHPEIPTFIYEGAGHAFCNDERPSYQEAAAKLSSQRTLAFLAEHMNPPGQKAAE